VAHEAHENAGLTVICLGAMMEYKRREWLYEDGTHYVYAEIDNEGDVTLVVGDGERSVDLLRYNYLMQGHFSQQAEYIEVGKLNLAALQKLIAVLAEFHSAFLSVLYPDGHTAGTPGAATVLEIDCSE
jgi:hypothetical protein